MYIYPDGIFRLFLGIIKIFQSQKIQNFDFFKKCSKMVQISNIALKMVFGPPKTHFRPNFIIWPNSGYVVENSILPTNHFFAIFRKNPIFRKLPFWLQKGIKKLNFFLDPKSMDQNLSNDVFRMFISGKH